MMFPKQRIKNVKNQNRSGIAQALRRWRDAKKCGVLAFAKADVEAAACFQQRSFDETGVGEHYGKPLWRQSGGFFSLSQLTPAGAALVNQLLSPQCRSPGFDLFQRQATGFDVKKGVRNRMGIEPGECFFDGVAVLDAVNLIHVRVTEV